MKDLKDKALTFIKKLKNIDFKKNKERLAMLICVPVTLIAIAVCFALLVGRGGGEVSGKADATGAVYAPHDQITSSAPPSHDGQSLEYQSLGDGTCLVSGIGSVRKSELKIPEASPSGEKVIGIGGRAFDGCVGIVSVEIPEGVISIGAGAFRNCPSLVMISVDPDNENFSSHGGTLFSKDKTRLICCPAARIGSNYMLNPNVRVIEDYAFDGIINITRILYEKSTADFESIVIGTGNERFSALPITCNYLPSK